MKTLSLALLTLLGLLLAHTTSAQTINKCQAGKKKCVIKKVKGLLGCHAKAEGKGEPVDQSCLDKVRDKFSHPSDNTGCIDKLEAKGGCSTLSDAAPLETKVDAFVLEVVQKLDPGYPVAVLNKCSAGKKKCVAKVSTKLLGCYAKADTKGVLDPDCPIKARQAFDGSLRVPPNAAKGCFETLEAKPTTICLTHDDTATIETEIDAFVNDVVCMLTPASGPQIDPQTFAQCQPGCGGAHCVPTALLGSLPVSPETCTAAGSAAGECVPDPIIAAAGHFVPNACTSIAGAEGRCLSTCLPAVAARALTLPQGVCAADERCMPCFDPTASDPTAPTGACDLACDAPAQPPLLLTCPWTGPPVFDPNAFAGCSPSCSGAHCVPTEIVPSGLQSLLATCTDGLCAPDPIIATDGNFDPQNCVAFAGTAAEGRCLSTCLPGIAIAAQPWSLEQSTCAAGDTCAPCINPSTGDSTGACTIGVCDAPAQPPFEFPGCCLVNGTDTGTCVPTSQLSAVGQAAYSQQECPSDAASWLCVPNEYLPGGQPFLCTDPFWGPGACVSHCVTDNLVFGQLDCPANYDCVPCALAPSTPGCS